MTKNAVVIRTISPVAKPLFDGKLLKKSLKLVALAAADEAGSKKDKRIRCLRRGVAEVTKALRKDERGVVFLASDVFPIDVLAHLPLLCEEKDQLYGYVCDKVSLGRACSSARPASVIMVLPPGETCSEAYRSAYKKIEKAVRAANPFFD